jgi:Cu/Zn superoxide dismutase
MVKLLGASSMLLGLALLPACEPRDETETETMEGEETTPPSPPPATTAQPREIPFEPGPAGATSAGMLRVTPQNDGGMEYAVELTGLTPGEHAWHIHSGACGTEGPVVLPITDTPDMEGVGDPVQVGEDGRGTATVTIPADRISALGTGPHSLHVHERAGTDPGPSVACANISTP